jgi:predicted nucleic acid-binding protein
MMAEVFADTVYWIAMIHPRDHWRDLAVTATNALGGRVIVTTHEVLTEVLNAFAEHGRPTREAAVRAVEQIMARLDVRVLPQSADSFSDGFALYRARPDKGYSLTDCISMAAMRLDGVIEILTHDAHFRQEGFTTLL